MKTATRKTNSKRSKSIKKDLKERVDKIRNPPLELPVDDDADESNDLQGGGMKTFILPNIIDIYTGLEVFFRKKLSGHSDTVTEAGNLIDNLYK